MCSLHYGTGSAPPQKAEVLNIPLHGLTDHLAGLQYHELVVASCTELWAVVDPHLSYHIGYLPL